MDQARTPSWRTGRGTRGVWLAAAVTIALAEPGAAAAAVEITHDRVDCIVAGRFPIIEARLQPPGEVARARVYFHAGGRLDWYYVEMKTSGDSAFEGVLPQPLGSIQSVEYYIEAVDRAFAQGRSPEYSARVVGNPGACASDLKTASALASVPSKLLIGAPQGAAAVPAGFSGLGLVGGAAAGGISPALLLGGVAVAGVAVGVAAGGSGGDGGGDGGGAAGGPSPSPTPQPTPTPAAGPDVTGRWAGSIVENPSTVQCSVTSDLELDLQQSGGVVSGTFQLAIRTVTPAPQDPCSVQPGEAFGGPASGTVDGSSVTLQLLIQSNPATQFDLQGTIFEDRLGGNIPPDADGPGGSWNVMRQ